MRVAIIGTGAMGGLFAALLSPFADIVMIGSWTEGLRAARDPGLILQRLDGSESQHIIFATSAISDVKPCDVALVVVKGWQTEEAATVANSVLKTGGLAITLQNGLGNCEKIADVVGGDRAIQGVTSEGATLLGPGLVRHAGQGHTYFAVNDKEHDLLNEFAAIFGRAGLAASVVDDAQSLIWGKLAINAGINPLTALLQVPNGRLIEDPHSLDIMRKAALEVSAVAASLDIMLPYKDAAAQAVAVAKATAANLSSMAQDIVRGMPTEIEQICGEVVRRGQEVGVLTPVNQALLHLVRVQVTQGNWRNALAGVPIELRPVFHYFSSMEASDDSDRSD